MFTLHNETGLMRIQTGLIHFGRVHTESGLSETGFEPVWSQSTSRCGLNAHSNRFRDNWVGGNVVSHDRTCVARQELLQAECFERSQ